MARADRALRLALALLALPAAAHAAPDPIDTVRDLWREWQQEAAPQVPVKPRALAATADAVPVALDDLAHPLTIERTLRDALAASPDAPDLTVPGGTARLGAFSLGSNEQLDGPLLVIRGRADIHGRLRGNLVAYQGDVVLHPGAVVTGSVLAIDGTVHEAGGEVTGEVRTLSGTALGPGAAPRSAAAQVLVNLAGVAGVLLTLLVVGGGMILFGQQPLEVVSDTVHSSFARAFVTGLLGQVLLLPTFGMLVVGLILTVAGILLVPFVVIVFALLVIAFVVGGAVAVAHAMGETWTRRQMARGIVAAPNAYRYLALGLAGPLLLWVVWALFGWVPVAGGLVRGTAILVTWLLCSVGFGAALLSRGGFREQFAGRMVPPEMLTDEYLWATPRFGVPAAKRPEAGGRKGGKAEE